MQLSRKFAKQVGSFWSETLEKQRRGSGPAKSKRQRTWTEFTVQEQRPIGRGRRARGASDGDE